MREEMEKFFKAKAPGIIMPPGLENGPEELPGLLLHIQITPALQSKLEQWMEKTGLPMTELGKLVARIGLLGVSTLIDAEENRITQTDVGSFFYRQSNEEAG
jgi:hypothetical protein